MRNFLLICLFATALFADYNYVGLNTLVASIKDNYIPSDEMFKKNGTTITDYTSKPQTQNYVTVLPELSYTHNKINLNVRPDFDGMVTKLNFTTNENINIGAYSLYTPAYTNPYLLNSARQKTYTLESGINGKVAIFKDAFLSAFVARSTIGNDETLSYGALGRTGYSGGAKLGYNLTKDLSSSVAMSRYAFTGAADSHTKYSANLDYQADLSKMYFLKFIAQYDKSFYDAQNPIFNQTRQESRLATLMRITKFGFLNVKPLYVFGNILYEQRYDNISFYSASRLYAGVGLGSAF